MKTIPEWAQEIATRIAFEEAVSDHPINETRRLAIYADVLSEAMAAQTGALDIKLDQFGIQAGNSMLSVIGLFRKVLAGDIPEPVLPMVKHILDETEQQLRDAMRP